MSAVTNKTYALIKSGGKQYRAEVGKTLRVELLNNNQVGDEVQLDVLLAFDGNQTHVGQPAVANFPVYAEVMGQVSGDKVKGLKYKASHNQCRQWGHRQKYTELKITGMGKTSQRKEK
jgi:large subunit ribosomal protein L21